MSFQVHIYSYARAGNWYICKAFASRFMCFPFFPKLLAFSPSIFQLSPLLFHLFHLFFLSPFSSPYFFASLTFLPSSPTTPAQYLKQYEQRLPIEKKYTNNLYIFSCAVGLGAGGSGVGLGDGVITVTVLVTVTRGGKYVWEYR